MSVYKKISNKEGADFLLPRHYSGRKPQIMYAFGEYQNDNLVAVCTFGMPASHCLCVGVCGESFQDNVIELNRLCRNEDYDGVISKFVAWCLKNIGDKIVVSYADTAMNHHGYVYQALNFIYTGATKLQTDKYTGGNKHPRHYNNEKQNGYRQIRSPKYRYVIFCGNKRFKKNAKKNLKYKVFPYPKGDNNTYQLGEFLQPIVIKDNSNRYAI